MYIYPDNKFLMNPLLWKYMCNFDRQFDSYSEYEKKCGIISWKPELSDFERVIAVLWITRFNFYRARAFQSSITFV